jgi:hypothetical protein
MPFPLAYSHDLQSASRVLVVSYRQRTTDWPTLLRGNEKAVHLDFYIKQSALANTAASSLELLDAPGSLFYYKGNRFLIKW